MSPLSKSVRSFAMSCLASITPPIRPRYRLALGTLHLLPIVIAVGVQSLVLDDSPNTKVLRERIAVKAINGHGSLLLCNLKHRLREHAVRRLLIVKDFPHAWQMPWTMQKSSVSSMQVTILALVTTPQFLQGCLSYLIATPTRESCAGLPTGKSVQFQSVQAEGSCVRRSCLCSPETNQ